MRYTIFLLIFGCSLHCLGAGILYYLLKLCFDAHFDHKKRRDREPEYVREINRRLRFNKVETERDLL